MPNRSSSLRVLHVIPSVSPCRGGPSKAVIEMVMALRQSGINAEIATTNDDGANKLDVELNTLIDYQGVPIRFFNRLSPPIHSLREYACSFAFDRWIRKHIDDYDLLHIHAIFSFCCSRTMQLARKRGKPYIVRPIGQLETWSLEQSRAKKSGYLKLIEHANLTGAEFVHFTSRSEKTQAMTAIPELSGKVIPLGLDMPIQLRSARAKMQARWELPRGVPVILFLSRLHPKKGLELLLKALSQTDVGQFQLIIAGEGDPEYVRSLKQKTIDFDIQAQCKFVGYVRGTEKNLLLQGADLYVLTSHSENFGIAVLEALASGTAVLVSDAVALSEQVIQHKLGFVCELNSDVIREQLVTALSDLESTQNRGNNARQFTEDHYQWPKIAHQLAKSYKNVVKQNDSNM